jgi:nucleotide-binding universal stress UspA family protein
MTTGTLDRVSTPTTELDTAVRPVMLLTLNVPFDEAAATFAIETAASTGADLWICDAIPLGFENYVGHAARQYAESLNRKYMQAVAERSRNLGVRTEQLVFHNRRPVAAAITVAHEERVGLLVFGASRKQLGRFTFRRAVGRLQRDAACLVWIPE